ncbi:MAG: hypothetical protein ACLUHE_14250 [Christensenellales bacterium]
MPPSGRGDDDAGHFHRRDRGNAPPPRAGNASALMGTLQAPCRWKRRWKWKSSLRLLGEKEPVRVSLRVGQERMYVVKSMAQFLRGLQEKDGHRVRQGLRA